MTKREFINNYFFNEIFKLYYDFITITKNINDIRKEDINFNLYYYNIIDIYQLLRNMKKLHKIAINNLQKQGQLVNENIIFKNIDYDIYDFYRMYIKSSLFKYFYKHLYIKVKIYKVIFYLLKHNIISIRLYSYIYFIITPYIKLIEYFFEDLD